MPSDPNIVDFLNPQQRALAEAQRLANLSAPDREFQYSGSSDRIGVDVATLKKMTEAILKDRAKRAREEKAEARRQERTQERENKLTRQDHERARKEADRVRKGAERIEREQKARQKKRDAAFAEIAELPKLTHAARLKEAAARLGEDFELLLEEFEVYYAARTLPEELAPWNEPVPTTELLGAIEMKFRRYVVVSDAIAAAVTLWVPFTYLIEIAVHAPKLLLTFPEKDAGKSTALGVLRWMVQRPYLAVEATGAATYRIVDRLKPTLLLDEADTLFDRSTVLAHIINASWTIGGPKIPRVGPRGEVVEFDPYSTQAIGMKGLGMPSTTLSRCIMCMIWPKLPSEVVEDFDERDDEEFKTIRRKLARWSIDNAVALRSATPECSFNNRTRKNWLILLAIADLAGGEWPRVARAAALELETDRDEPSENARLFAAIRDCMGARAEITSADICKALAADPSSEWANFRGAGSISQAQLAALLRPFGIRPVTLHPTKRAGLTRHGYRRARFENAWARLLQKPTKDPNTRTLDPEGK
jgi:hypothetical protein